MVPLWLLASPIRQPSKLIVVEDIFRNSIHSLLGKPICGVGSAISSSITISYRLATWALLLPVSRAIKNEITITLFIAVDPIAIGLVVQVNKNSYLFFCFLGVLLRSKI